MRRPPPLVHDVAALERTALAWERTAISLGAVGLLLLKVVDGGVALLLSGGLLTAAAIVIVLVVVPLGYRRARDRVDPERPESAFLAQDRWRTWTLAGTALAVSAAVVAVAVDLVTSGR